MEIEKIVVGDYESNCYLVESNGEFVIIDPGEDAQIIMEKLEELGIIPKFIINTHHHFDNTFANEEVRERTGAKVLIHEAEEGYIDFQPDKFLKDGDVVNIGDEALTIVHTPGHTKGSVCLVGEGMIFTGDTLLKDAFGRTDMPGGDEEELAHSLQKVVRVLEPGMTVYPGHGEEFNLREMVS